MKKKICMLLTLTMLTVSMAGCSSSDTSSTGNDSSSSGGSTTESSNGGTGDLSNQEPYTVVMKYPGDSSSEDLAAISAAASAITEELYNTSIEVQRSGWGTYFTEITLALTSGEKLDLFYENRATYVSAASSGQILEVGQYFDEYGPDLRNVISDSSWNTTTLDGGIYAFPANKETSVSYGFIFNKEMADATGIDYSKITTEAEMEELLVAVKELYPDTYPIVSDMGSMYTAVALDDLGDDFGVLMDMNSTDLLVEDWYATDRFRELCELHYKWSQMGLIMPDASSNSDSTTTLISAKKAFGFYQNTKPGIEIESQNASGVEMATITLTDTWTSTTRVDILWMIPYSCEAPERVVQVVNEIYTNPELQTILVDGIEGTHYEYINDEKTMISYPEGVNGTNTGYIAYPWAWLNQMITPVWEGNEEDLWEQTIVWNESATVSIANGFVWDNSMVSNEVTACWNVYEQYADALICGDVDPAVYLPEYLQALESAGVHAIVEEKQRQLDEWYATK
ncbi:MAG: ABC transporter substrate-binding protein [Eubacteriales bacterium]